MISQFATEGLLQSHLVDVGTVSRQDGGGGGRARGGAQAHAWRDELCSVVWEGGLGGRSYSSCIASGGGRSGRWCLL